MQKQGGEPGEDALPEDHGGGPAASQLPADGGHGGHAGGVEEAEHQQAPGGKGREGGGNVSGEEDAQGGDHGLLCEEPGDEGGADAPVAQAQGPEQGRQEPRQEGQNAVLRIGHGVQPQIEALQEPDHHRGDEDVLRIGHGVQPQIEALQEPDHHRGDEDDSEGPLQKVLGLLPQEADDVFGAGQPVVGKLHDEGGRLALEEGALIEVGDEHRHKYAQEVQARHDEAALAREEGADEEGVDGELGGAAHKGGQQDGHLPIPFAGQGASGHDRGDRAAEAH